MDGIITVKSFSSYQVNDALLVRIVEAIKTGEADARRYSRVESFEVYYNGFRSRIAFGRIMIIPAKLAESPEEFPSALLYGALVREIRPEDLAELYTFKLGESEFDEYDGSGMKEIKDRLFKDADGIYRSIILFVPTWANVRDFVVLKMTRDFDVLKDMVRHQIFGAYFDPRFSSAIDHMTEDGDKIDINNITPKINFPGLAENPGGREEPNLQPGDGVVKTASGPKPMVLLAADTIGKVNEEFLEPGELAVIDSLAAELKSKVEGGTDTPAEAIKSAGGKQAGTYSWNVVPDKGAFLWHVFETGFLGKKEVGYGFAADQEEAKRKINEKLRKLKGTAPPATVASAKAAEHSTDSVTVRGAPGQYTIRHYNSDNGETETFRSDSQDAPEDFVLEVQDRYPFAHVHLKQASTDDSGAETGLRRQPDYDEQDSHSNAANELAKQGAGDRDVEHEQISSSTDEELLRRLEELKKIGERNAVKGTPMYPQRDLRELQRIKSELYCRRTGTPSKPWTTHMATVPVVAAEGGKLYQRQGKLTAKAASGHEEALRIIGKSVRWVRPQQFTAAFRNQVAVYIRNPRNLKQAEVPLGTDEILSGLMKDFGPAPVAHTPEASRIAPAAAKTDLQKLEDRRNPDKHDDTLREHDPSPDNRGEAEKPEGASKPREKKDAAYTRRGETCQTPGCGRYLDSWGVCPNVSPQEASRLGNSRGQGIYCDPLKAPARPSSVAIPEEWRRQACAACGGSVLTANGSEVAPSQFLHSACHTALKQASSDTLIPFQVVAAFYPEIFDGVSDSYYVNLAMKNLGKQGDFLDLTENEQRGVLGTARKLQQQSQFREFRNQDHGAGPGRGNKQNTPGLPAPPAPGGIVDRVQRVKAMNLFHPGDVLKEFDSELLGTQVEDPAAAGGFGGFEHTSLDGLPGEGDPYISTDPAAAMGIGRDGKEQVLEGAPLRQENDIRGYMFDQEYYSQQQGLDPRAFLASAAVERVSKKAGVEENKGQFADFLKRAMGEIAAAFIAAFKVTARAPFNKVPGTGELQLDLLEQQNNPVAMGTTQIGSRVRFLVGKLTDSQIQEAIDNAFAQSAVWNEDPNGGYKYEVFVRPESLDKQTLTLKYSFVLGTEGM